MKLLFSGAKKNGSVTIQACGTKRTKNTSSWF
jgi:hypothetical protein